MWRFVRIGLVDLGRSRDLFCVAMSREFVSLVVELGKGLLVVI